MTREERKRGRESRIGTRRRGLSPERKERGRRNLRGVGGGGEAEIGEKGGEEEKGEKRGEEEGEEKPI